MKKLPELFEKNKQWAKQIEKEDATFFDRLSKIQSPKYLWIGCSDSRVPANQITGLEPGEVFVHRNIANLVVHTDLNCLSVIQYAVEALKVTDIIVCGHYGCGGVNAAMGSKKLGIIDNWIRNIKDVYQKYSKELSACKSEEDRSNRLCELNVIEQVKNVCHTSIVQNAWDEKQALNVHGWVYGLDNGLLKDLNVTVSSAGQLEEIFQLSK